MFLFYYFSVVLFFSFLVMISSNMIIWWSIFLLMTILFISINKSLKSSVVLINYFILQEVLGLLFLFAILSFFQFFVLCLKVGVAPFHFWIFSVLSSVYDFGLLWFLTFQKLPYILVFLNLYYYYIMLFLFLGIILCYLQIFLIKNYKFLVMISSVESFNWILLVNIFSFNSSLLMFFYYVFLMSIMLFKVYLFSDGSGTWESIFVFLNLPFTLSFFVKIFTVGYLFTSNFYYVFLLFLMFLSSLAFSFWLVILSTKFDFFKDVKNKNLMFVWLGLTIVCLVCHYNMILVFHFDMVAVLVTKF